MCLSKAGNSIRDASAVCVIENALLSDQLADHQELLVEMPSGGQKAATTSDQGINAHQITLEAAELLFDCLADLADSGPLLFGHCKKLLPRPFAVCAWLVSKTFPDLRIHRINQDLSHLPGFIEQG